MSELEETFAGQLRMLFIEQGWDQDAIEREYEFCKDRKWRADFGLRVYDLDTYEFPPLAHRSCDVSILIDIEGTSRYKFGRHERIEGYTQDVIKYSAASALGYTVLRGTSQMVHDGVLIEMVRQVLLGELELLKWKVA